MANLKIIIVFIFIIFSNSLFLGCEAPQPNAHEKTTDKQKQIDSLEQKIISLGFTPYMKSRPIYWDGVLLLKLYETNSEPAMAKFLHRLYQELKNQTFDYPYVIYIDESFEAGMVSYKNGYQFYLQFKYNAGYKAIQLFIQKYKKIYQYKKVEKKLLTSDNKHDGKRFAGMPIVIDTIIYTYYLCQYYDWLKYHTQQKTPNFNSLIRLNQTFPHKKVYLWLEYNKHSSQKITFSAFNGPFANSKDNRVVFIHFGLQTPLNKITSPSSIVVKKAKELLLSSIESK